MLSRWLQRGQIGQILAPDSSKKDEEATAELSEFKGGWWSVVAPDPNFYSPEAIERKNPTPNNKPSVQGQNQSYPSENANANQAVLSHFTPSKENQQFQSSSLSSFQSPNNDYETVEQLVLCAAKDLATCVASPPLIWEDHKKLFNFCASSTPLTAKQLRKVKKMLQKDPSLAHCRASKMGFLLPDGFTPLHAAAFVGNYEVALILIDLCLDDGNGNDDDDETGDVNSNKESEKEYVISLDTRDVQGRTPLHIASEQGHVKLVKLLKTKMSERNPDGLFPIGENAPIDLAGRTPLGWAATSREAMACQNRDELRMELFSPGDKSVFGKKTPALDRIGGGKRNNCDGMDLCYGFAEMPGLRIEMEDAICHTFPLSVGSETKKNNIEVGFFGVFDGHGDGGISSNYIADHIVQCLTVTQEWKEFDGNVSVLAQALSKACSDIDIDLKAVLTNGSSVGNGGTTGIMALVTPKDVIIGNVGDSRCILVQRVTGCITLSDAIEKKLVLEEIMESEKEESKEPQSRLPQRTSEIKVKPLSTDHKPNLSEEKLRIEKAGLEVVEESFPSGDKEKEEITSIWKIKKSAREMIAVSRAFGDFDYKANEDLKFEEQAIVCVPEIMMHERDHHSDMFLVLACDGVFDVMSNDEVGEFVAKRADERKQNCTNNLSAEVLPEIGDDLLKHCLELGSSDNMSVLIVALPSSNDIINDGAPRKLEFADV